MFNKNTLFAIIMLLLGLGLGMLAHETGFIKPDPYHMQSK